LDGRGAHLFPLEAQLVVLITLPKDVEAMQRVLAHPEMGGFDEVKVLINLDPEAMQVEIETMFKSRKRDDLVLLFFSGHGVKEPKIYAVEEGFKIRLAKAAIGDPKLIYRKQVERFANHGEISQIGRRILDDMQESLRIPSEEAKAIASEVLKPFQEYQQKLQRYEQVFREAIAQEYPFSEDTRQELQHSQEILGLREPDVAPRWRL
jgi:hypothetical protein